MMQVSEVDVQPEDTVNPVVFHANVYVPDSFSTLKGTVYENRGLEAMQCPEVNVPGRPTLTKQPRDSPPNASDRCGTTNARTTRTTTDIPNKVFVMCFTSMGPSAPRPCAVLAPIRRSSHRVIRRSA